MRRSNVCYVMGCKYVLGAIPVCCKTKHYSLCRPKGIPSTSPLLQNYKKILLRTFRSKEFPLVLSFSKPFSSDGSQGSFWLMVKLSGSDVDSDVDDVIPITMAANCLLSPDAVLCCWHTHSLRALSLFKWCCKAACVWSAKIQNDILCQLVTWLTSDRQLG